MSRILMFCLALSCFKSFGDLTKSTNHRRTKRFMSPVFPGNSVIQFALGLALPADVKGRNIATNSGILINIGLPTNLTQLQPPKRSIKGTAAHAQLTQLVTTFLNINNFNEKDCYDKSICLMSQYNKYKTSLIFDIFNEVIKELLASNAEGKKLSLDHTRKINNKDDCHDLYPKCDSPILKSLFSV